MITYNKIEELENELENEIEKHTNEDIDFDIKGAESDEEEDGGGYEYALLETVFRLIAFSSPTILLVGCNSSITSISIEVCVVCRPCKSLHISSHDPQSQLQHPNNEAETGPQTHFSGRAVQSQSFWPEQPDDKSWQ